MVHRTAARAPPRIARRGVTYQAARRAGSREALTSGTEAARFQTLTQRRRQAFRCPTLDCAAKRERGAFSRLAFSINNKWLKPAAGLSRLYLHSGGPLMTALERQLLLGRPRMRKGISLFACVSGERTAATVCGHLRSIQVLAAFKKAHAKPKK